MPSKYDGQIREKAVRLVRDHAEDYPREWAAIKAVSGRLGMNAETLRKWLRQAEVDAGQRAGGEQRGVGGDPGVDAQERRVGAHDRDPEGGVGFLHAGQRPAAALICEFITGHREEFGVVPICRALTELGTPIAPRT
jgi:transposase-like protein